MTEAFSDNKCEPLLNACKSRNTAHHSPLPILAHTTSINRCCLILHGLLPLQKALLVLVLLLLLPLLLLLQEQVRMRLLLQDHLCLLLLLQEQLLLGEPGGQRWHRAGAAWLQRVRREVPHGCKAGVRPWHGRCWCRRWCQPNALLQVGRHQILCLTTASAA